MSMASSIDILVARERPISDFRGGVEQESCLHRDFLIIK